MTLSKDLWLDKLQIRKKMCPPMMPIVCLGKESTISDVFLSSRELSLSSVSSQKDCLTSLRCLSSLRSARQPLRSVRHHSFLPTIAESKSSSSESKVRPCLLTSTGRTLSLRRNIYSNSWKTFSNCVFHTVHIS